MNTNECPSYRERDVTHYRRIRTFSLILLFNYFVEMSNNLIFHTSLAGIERPKKMVLLRMKHPAAELRVLQCVILRGSDYLPHSLDAEISHTSY